MKKGKIILSVVALVAIAGSALAFKSNKRSAGNLFTKVTGICRPVACHTQDQGLGVCDIPVPLYTGTTASCPNRVTSAFKALNPGL